MKTIRCLLVDVSSAGIDLLVEDLPAEAGEILEALEVFLIGEELAGESAERLEGYFTGSEFEAPAARGQQLLRSFCISFCRRARSKHRFWQACSLGSPPVERRLHWVAAQLACLRDVAQIQDRTFSRPAAVAADEPKGKGRRRPPKDGAGQSANAQA